MRDKLAEKWNGKQVKNMLYIDRKLNKYSTKNFDKFNIDNFLSKIRNKYGK